MPKQVFDASTYREKNSVLSHLSTSGALDPLVVNSNYQFIQTQAVSAGVSNLRSSLSYANSVASISRWSQGEALKDELIRKDDSAKTKLDLLQRQEEFFNSITKSNLLTDYQNFMMNSFNEFIQNNPSREGLYENILEKHDEKAKEILGTPGVPELKEDLYAIMLKCGVDNASSALSIEVQAKERNALIALEDVVNDSIAFISNGGNPEQALLRIKPIADSLPNTMENKQAYLNKARKEILNFSIAQQAIVNPSLAIQNLKSPLYKDIDPAHRLHVIKIAEAKNIDNQQLLKEQNARVLIDALLNPKSDESNYIKQIFSGDISFAQLEADKDQFSPEAFNFFKEQIKKRDLSKIDFDIHNATIRFIANRDGFFGVSSKDQNRIWNEDMVSAIVRDPLTGSPVTNDDGIPMLEGEAPLSYLANKALKFKTEIIPLKDKIMASVMSNVKEEVHQGIQAWKVLKENNSIVLGDFNSDFNKKMQTALSTIELGGNEKTVQRQILERDINVSPEERKELEDKILAPPTAKDRPPDEFNPSEIKKYFPDFDKDDPKQLYLARKMYNETYVKSKGQKLLAYKDVAASLAQAVVKSSLINGSGIINSGLGLPESFISSNNIPKLRSNFNKLIKSKLDSIFDKSSLEQAMYLNGNLKILYSHSDDSFDHVTISNKRNSKEKGYLFLVPSNMLGTYEVRFNFHFNDPFSRDVLSKYSPPVNKVGYNTGFSIIDPTTQSPLKVTLTNALEFLDVNEYKKIRNDTSKLIDPKTEDQILDLDLALDQRSSENIKKVYQYAANN